MAAPLGSVDSCMTLREQGAGNWGGRGGRAIVVQEQLIYVRFDVAQSTGEPQKQSNQQSSVAKAACMTDLKCLHDDGRRHCTIKHTV